MRINVVGESETAKVVAGYLGQTFRVTATLPDYTVHIEESSRPKGILLDSVDSPLESNILRYVRELTRNNVEIQTHGGNRSDREVRIIVSQAEEDQRAVEIGVYRGFSAFLVHAPVQPKKRSNGARAGWWKRIWAAHRDHVLVLDRPSKEQQQIEEADARQNL